MTIHNVKRLKETRRKLRSAMTPAEAAIWKHLQGSQLAGAKFRRQHSIGPYVIDFYCPEHKIAIELDGAGHYLLSGAEADAQRTSYLHSKGIRVLRFENKAVFETLVSSYRK